MADVKGFGNVWPAVIHDDLLRMFRFRYFHFIRRSHFRDESGQESLLYAEVEETRPDCFHGACAVFPRRIFSRHFIRYDKWSFVVTLRGRHRAVALIFAQIRPVGTAYRTEASVIPGCLKCFRELFRQYIQKMFHICVSF